MTGIDDSFFDFGNSKKRGTATIEVGNCLDVLDRYIEEGVMFDAIVTDPPYEIALHGKSWDSTGIAFSVDFWTKVYRVLKPGGFLVSFAASRMYHRVAVAIEDAGFSIFPMLQWDYGNQGLPKPANLSELFDRDTLTKEERNIVGTSKGSGFTKANVDHGAQQRTKTTFVQYERGQSPEGKEWMGYYYGVNCFKPCIEPAVMAQKPPSTKKMIDNVRQHGVGGVNLGALKEIRGQWPTTTFRHAKATKAEHGSDHPSVKPVSLMEEIVLMACPTGGSILDPFAGSGSTGVAAINLGFYPTLIEQDSAMADVIRRRCEAKPTGR